MRYTPNTLSTVELASALRRIADAKTYGHRHCLLNSVNYGSMWELVCELRILGYVVDWDPNNGYFARVHLT